MHALNSYPLRGAAPMSLSESLQALGSSETRYSFEKPDFSLLERFESPLLQTRHSDPLAKELGVMRARDGYSSNISIKCPEFTSLCPKTGQPDFATILIDYAPDEWCVESKSLKLYLMGYRNHGSFHEECVQQITSDLVQLLQPRWIQVQGQFTPRGGIPFWPTVSWSKP